MHICAITKDSFGVKTTVLLIISSPDNYALSSTQLVANTPYIV